MNLFLEITAVILNLIYLVLLMKEKIACWFFGIAGSLVSIYLFYSIGLYSESILYIYYVIIGIYGYLLWNRKDGKDIKVSTINWIKHLGIILFGGCIALVLGFTFERYTDAVNPYLDAFTTIFSFIASYLEARKIISSWIFWLIINMATVILYLEQNLPIYLMLTLVYVVFSVLGFLEWRKKLQSSLADAKAQYENN